MAPFQLHVADVAVCVCMCVCVCDRESVYVSSSFQPFSKLPYSYMPHHLKLGFLCWVGGMFSLELLEGIPGFFSFPEACRVRTLAVLLWLDGG